MVIYQLFDEEKMQKKIHVEEFTETFELDDQRKYQEKEPVFTSKRWISTLMTRFFFLLLLLADLLWVSYTMLMLIIVGMICLFTGCKWHTSNRGFSRYWLTLKRCLVCGLSLFVGLFSPTFGIMIACTYFMTYDKEGMEEIIPASFKQTFQPYLKT